MARAPTRRAVGPHGGSSTVLADGQLGRIGEDSGGGADQELWKHAVLPIYTRTCSQCHLPGATSVVDLCTYNAWASRRKLIEQRVIEGKPTPMPPPGAAVLTADEIEGLKRWLASSSD